MQSRIFLLCIIILFTLPLNVVAHSGIQESSPSEESVIDSQLDVIQLRFDTKIESISTLEIQNQSQHGTVKLSKVEVTNDTLTGYLENPLPPGSYLVIWKIVGRDGHLVEGQYSFESIFNPSTKSSNAAESTTSAGNNSTQTDNTETTDQQKDASSHEPELTSTNGNKSSSIEQISSFYLILFTLIGCISLGLIYLIWVKGRTS
jgi:methionine-rich copper-binding protein CopC